jgi:hypothetical protein
LPFDIRPCEIGVVRNLCERFHGYGTAGGAAAYCFAIYEDDEPVAGYAWQPPPLGAAKSVCPEAPWGVLSLSRMVAVPKSERQLKHISKPLRLQMKRLIDRTRWPVLVTFSDEGQGHTGYVYKCSGWEKTTRSRVKVMADAEGVRRSRYSNGRDTEGLVFQAHTFIQRWEHWACPRGDAASFMCEHGWERVPIEGKFWRSGNQAFKILKP